MYKIILAAAFLTHSIQAAVVGVDSGSLHIRMFHYDNRTKDYTPITDENSSSSILNMHSVNQQGQFSFGKSSSSGGYVVPFGIQALYNPQLYPYLSQIATYNLNLSTTQQAGDKIPIDQLPEDLKLFASGTEPQKDTVLLERIYAHYFNYLQDLAQSSRVHYFPVTFSVPNYMSTLTREIIKATAQEVNFKISNLVVEESALALGVAEKIDDSRMDSFVVIVDMGHVSSNFTVVRVYSSENYKKLHPENSEKGKRFVEVLKTQNTDFNGLQVTLSIFKSLKNKLEKNSQNLDEDEKNKLVIISNKLKSKLSTAQQTKTLFSRTDGSLIEVTAERSAYEEDPIFQKNLKNYFSELDNFIKSYIKESGIEKFYIVPFGGHSLLPAVQAKFNYIYGPNLMPVLKPTTDLGQYLTLFQLQKSMIFKPEARILVKEILHKNYIMKLIKEDSNEVIVEKTLWAKGDAMEGKKEVEAMLKPGDYRVIISSITPSSSPSSSLDYNNDSSNDKEELEADFEFILVEKEDISTALVFSFNGFRNVQYHVTTTQSIPYTETEDNKENNDNKLMNRRISTVKNFPVVDEKSLKEIKDEIKKLNKIKEERRKLSENRNKLDSMIYNIAGELENEESVLLEFGKEEEISKLKEYLVSLEKEFEEKKFDETVFGKERIDKEIKEVNRKIGVMKGRKKEKAKMEYEIEESMEFYEKEKKEIKGKIEKWTEEDKENKNKSNEESKDKSAKEDKKDDKADNNTENDKEDNQKDDDDKGDKKEDKPNKKLSKIDRYLKLEQTVIKRLQQISDLKTKISTLSKNEDAKVSSHRLRSLRIQFANRRAKIDKNIISRELWNSPEMKRMMEKIRKKKQQEEAEKDNSKKEDADKNDEKGTEEDMKESVEGGNKEETENKQDPDKNEDEDDTKNEEAAKDKQEDKKGGNDKFKGNKENKQNKKYYDSKKEFKKKEGHDMNGEDL